MNALMGREPTYLVTGAAGLIGSHLVSRLRANGDSVISVDHIGHFSQDERPEHQNIDFQTTIDRSSLPHQLKDFNKKSTLYPIDGIFHIGACTDTTLMDHDYFRQMNLEYSQMLWEFASHHQIPLIYASSAATYGAGEHGYDDDESHIKSLQPLNPYGQSKQDFDLWVLEQESKGITPSFWSGYKFFNVYGYGERHKKNMASVALHAFDQIKKEGKVKLFKSEREDIPHGEQKRDFIWVHDVTNVLLFAMEQSVSRGIYNLGTGTARTFLDFVRPVFQALGQPEQIEWIDMPDHLKKRYQYFTQANITRLRQAGYSKAFHSIEQGVFSYAKKLKAFYGFSEH